MMARRNWLISLVLLTATPCLAQVYRSVDANGNVTYSDTPQDENAEMVFVAAQRPASAPPPATAEQAQPAPGSLVTMEIEEPGELQRERREPTPEERAEDRAKNCATARDRAERYAVSHRLYRETPGGGREYMDATELTQARTQSVADVQKWCD